MEIEATIKFRHAYLSKFLKLHNLARYEFAKNANVHLLTFGKLLNLKAYPRSKTQEKIFLYVSSQDPEVTWEILFPADLKKAVEAFSEDKVAVKSINFDHLLEHEKTRLALSSPFEETSSKELEESVNKILSTLDKNSRTVLKLYYGFDGPEMTLDEISKKLNLSKERIRQIRNKAYELFKGRSTRQNLYNNKQPVDLNEFFISGFYKNRQKKEAPSRRLLRFKLSQLSIESTKKKKRHAKRIHSKELNHE